MLCAGCTAWFRAAIKADKAEAACLTWLMHSCMQHAVIGVREGHATIYKWALCAADTQCAWLCAS